MSEDINDPLDNEMPEEPKDESMDESLPIEEIDTGFDDGDITDDDKLWALLGYVFTPLVPIILMLMEDKKDRAFIKAHNAQALAWGVVSVLIGGATSFLCFPPFLFWAASIYWGWKAYQGEYVTIPVITDFVKGQGWA
ncbi:MAG: DUF4870 domain-containing protein [Chloroflexi bacterium]|nr:DUF4870 domain-containing protein [Chloroflexota bacterium]